MKDIYTLLTEDMLLEAKHNLNSQGEETPNFDNALSQGKLIKKMNLEPLYCYESSSNSIIVKIKKIQIRAY